MSRGSRGRAPGGRMPAAGPRRNLSRPIAAAAAVALVAGIVLWARLGHRDAERSDERDALTAMTPQAAYESALRLSQDGHHLESLPYYRRALRGPQRVENPWPIHFNYGAALYNVGLQVRALRGVPVPVVRSSIERVALMREALAQLDTAQLLARTPGDRATVMHARGERFEVWGFPWEAFILMRQAQWTDPGRKELTRKADGFMLVLEHPEHRWTGATERGKP